MPSFWRVNTLLTLALVVTTLTVGNAATSGSKVYSLSLDEFANTALKNSLRSRIAEGSFSSSRWGWKASRRNLSWPSLSATAGRTKTFTNDDLGTETEEHADQGSLTLTQPTLIGTELSMTGTWNDTQTDEDAPLADTTSFSRQKPQFVASVTQPLFLFTGNTSWRSKRTADLQWSNDQDSFRGEMLSIEFDARTRYYNLLLQMETTEVERKKMESAKLVNDVTRALVRAGKLAEVEAVRSDIRAKKDFRRIQNSESELEKALNEAKDFLYIPASARLVLTSKLEYKPFQVPLEKIILAALDNNPNLLISRRSMELNEIDLKDTREGDNPRVNATGRYERVRERSDSEAPLEPYNWTVGVGMEWALFDASQTRLKTRQSEVSLENSRRSYENAERQLRVDVENAYIEIKRAEDQISDFEPQRMAAQRNVNAIRLQYRNGLTRLTDVFDAENELRDLELEYLGLLVNFNSSRDRLKVLVGKDLSTLARGGQ